MKFNNKLIYRSCHARILSHVAEGLCTPTPLPVATPLSAPMLHAARCWMGRRGIALCAVTGLQAFGVEADTGVPGVALVYTEKCFDGLEHRSRVGGR